MDANLTQGDGAFRFAPSTGAFRFLPNPDLLEAINDAAGSEFTADEDLFVVAHRFVRHGNRDWRWDYREYDVSARLAGRLTETSATTSASTPAGWTVPWRATPSSTKAGFASEILAGNYDLENPFSDADEHLAAIERSSLTEEQDFGGDYQGAPAGPRGGRVRDRRPPCGMDERGRARACGIARRHRLSRPGRRHLRCLRGAGFRRGQLYRRAKGRRRVRGDVPLPLLENLDLRVAGRADDLDDVGGLKSWRFGAEYRPTDLLTLRTSWSAGERPPSLPRSPQLRGPGPSLYRLRPGLGSPPRSCTGTNPRQVTRVTSGNPDLDPSDTERVAIGAEVRKRPWFGGRRVVSALALGPPRAQQRRLGHAKP